MGAALIIIYYYNIIFSGNVFNQPRKRLYLNNPRGIRGLRTIIRSKTLKGFNMVEFNNLFPCLVGWSEGYSSSSYSYIDKRNFP